LSSPQHSCNPTADSVNGAQDGALIVVAAVSLTILLYCVMNGTTILNVFNPEVHEIDFPSPFCRLYAYLRWYFL
jgi:hypothetical protein